MQNAEIDIMNRYVGDYKYIGRLNDLPLYYNKNDGYIIEIYGIGLRNPTKNETRQIKAKFGDLEKKCLQGDL